MLLVSCHTTSSLLSSSIFSYSIFALSSLFLLTLHSPFSPLLPLIILHFTITFFLFLIHLLPINPPFHLINQFSPHIFAITSMHLSLLFILRFVQHLMNWFFSHIFAITSYALLFYSIQDLFNKKLNRFSSSSWWIFNVVSKNFVVVFNVALLVIWINLNHIKSWLYFYS